MTCWSKEELEAMLFDVVNELDLSDGMVEKHGPHGTAPAVLVREVLSRKNLEIAMLRRGFIDVASVHQSPALRPEPEAADEDRDPEPPRVTGSPKEIWLNYGEIEHDCTHAECYRDGDVTWCQDKVFDSDVKYVLAAQLPEPPQAASGCSQRARSDDQDQAQGGQGEQS